MSFSRLGFVSLLVVCLVTLFTAEHAMAQPDRALALRPGGYVFADYPEVFDTTDLTIEGWFYLNRLPKKRERWVLFAKPGSYLLEIDGRNPGNPSHAEKENPKAILFMEYSVVTGKGGMGGSKEAFEREAVKKWFPMKQWFHIAWQLGGIGPVEHQIFLNRLRRSRGSTGPEGLRRSEHPFLLGGGEEKIINRWTLSGTAGSILGTFDGMIDEVRISNILRYQGRQIDPPKHFEIDANTVALWRFNSERGQGSFVDASGNGYTMSAINAKIVVVRPPRAVNSRSKLTTTWAELKYQ